MGAGVFVCVRAGACVPWGEGRGSYALVYMHVCLEKSDYIQHTCTQFVFTEFVCAHTHVVCVCVCACALWMRACPCRCRNTWGLGGGGGEARNSHEKQFFDVGQRAGSISKKIFLPARTCTEAYEVIAILQ